MMNNTEVFKDIEKDVNASIEQYYQDANAIKKLWHIVQKRNIANINILESIKKAIDYWNDIFNNFKHFTTYKSSIGDIRLSYKLEGPEIGKMHNALECMYNSDVIMIQDIILNILQYRCSNSLKICFEPDCIFVVADDTDIIKFIITLMPYTMFRYYAKQNKIIIKRRTLGDDKFGNDDLCNTEMDKLAYKYIDSNEKEEIKEKSDFEEFKLEGDEKPEESIVEKCETVDAINHIKSYLDHMNAEEKSSGIFYAITRLRTFDEVAEYFKNNTKYILQLVDTSEDENGMVPIKIEIDENNEQNTNADMIKFLCGFVNNLFSDLDINDLRILPLKDYTQDQIDYITNKLGVDTITFKSDKESKYKTGFVINCHNREKLIKEIDKRLESLGYSYNEISDYFAEQSRIV